MKYPPIANMLGVQIFASDEAEGVKIAGWLAQQAKELAESMGETYGWSLKERVQIIGPAPAGIGKINDVYRFVFYIKHADMEILVQQKDYLEEVAKSVEHRGMNIQFDFNPMSGL
jgi:primosomal protein N' (replication factor Y)